MLRRCHLTKSKEVGWGWGGGQGQTEPRDWTQGSRCLACGCLEQQSVPGTGTHGRGGSRRGKGHVTWLDSLSVLDVMLTFSLGSNSEI